MALSLTDLNEKNDSAHRELNPSYTLQFHKAGR